MNLGTTGISPLMFVAEASFSERERGTKKEGEREGLPGQMHCFYRCKTAKKKKKPKTGHFILLQGGCRAT